MASLGETFVTKSYDKRGKAVAAPKPKPMNKSMNKSRKTPLSGTVSSGKAAGKALGPAAPGVIANQAKGREAMKRMQEAQRRGMAKTRATAPERARIAKSVAQRDKDAKMAANQKKWSKANKKGMN